MRSVSNASGNQQWPVGGVLLCNAPFNQTQIAASVDGAGGAIAAWTDDRNATVILKSAIYAQRVSADGAPLWTPNGVVVCNEPDLQFQPAVVPDGQDGAIVAWSDSRKGDRFGSDLYAQRLDGDGNPLWTLNGVVLRTATRAVAWTVGLPTLSQGAVFAWSDFRDPDGDIYAQNVNSDGTLGDDVPVATQASLVTAEHRAGRNHLIWYSSERSVFSVHRRSAGADWTLITREGPDGSGRIEFEDASVVAGNRYDYRLGIREGGQERYFGEATIDVPALQLRLHGALPNPTRGALRASFTLASSRPTRIELWTVTSRRVAIRSVGGLGAGTHVVDLSRGGELTPGMYFLKLVQDDQEMTKKVVVLPDR